MCGYFLFTPINGQFPKDRKAYLWLRPWPKPVGLIVLGGAEFVTGRTSTHYVTDECHRLLTEHLSRRDAEHFSEEEKVSPTWLWVPFPGLPSPTTLGMSFHFLYFAGSHENWGVWYFVLSLVSEGIEEENFSFYSPRFFGWFNHQINVRQINKRKNKFNYIHTKAPIRLWNLRRSQAFEAFVLFWAKEWNSSLRLPREEG